MKNLFVILCMLFLTIACTNSKKYHLKGDQKKTQNFEHKPAIKITQENLENKEKNQKHSYKQQKKNEANKKKNQKDQKSKKKSTFDFY